MPNHALALAIGCWGAHAQRFARLHASATLSGVFARCLHLYAPDGVLCIGAEAIGAGPLNATLDLEGWQRARHRLPMPGDRARLGAGRIAIGGVLFATEGARAWRPPCWPQSIAPAAAAAGLRRLTERVRRHAPADGLARLAFGVATGPPTPLHRLAQPRINRLTAWTRARLGAGARTPAPADLLGLGPGLTPSGDDLLCGTLLALNALARADAAGDLYAALRRAPACATSVLSWALLAAAAEGEGGAPLHALIIAVLEDHAFEDALAAVAGHGATSGWDTLAGAAIAVSAAYAPAAP